METQEKEYLTTNELADKAGVHRNTIYRWIEEGAPHRRIGEKGLRFVWEEVDEWLKDRTEAA